MKGKWHCCSNNAATPNEKYQARVYRLWYDILTRCYSSRELQRHPTYVGVIVCDEWLIFSNFIKDLPNLPNYRLWLNNPNQRIALDKEFHYPSRVYSPQTCGFNTIGDNTTEMNKRAKARKVEGTSLLDGSKIYFDSTRDAGRNGFNQSNVSACCIGEQKYHKGYTWKYI